MGLHVMLIILHVHLTCHLSVPEHAASGSIPQHGVGLKVILHVDGQVDHRDPYLLNLIEIIYIPVE